ncbi:hypothetical protein T265_11413 [Opisthorchis viverrini]|uniref:Uncharacterized protein n=1 Tax=Opisthorchis viverrini TaxID=6198 RepID=A0A074Z319_OPIVI|nr:hypothetical protein T265_11413 [Opisthorchis viverrini]KER19922.1 hypothetical protein T265_11413 [Opisthorchis viverrini]
MVHLHFPFSKRPTMSLSFTEPIYIRFSKSVKRHTPYVDSRTHPSPARQSALRDSSWSSQMDTPRELDPADGWADPVYRTE